MILQAMFWYVDHGFDRPDASCTKASDIDSFLMPVVSSQENQYSVIDSTLTSKPSFCSIDDKYFSSIYVPGW